MDGPTTRACWLRTPRLVGIKCATLQTKLKVLEALFGLRALHVLNHAPTLLLSNSNDLEVRVAFVKFLGAQHVPLAGLWAGRNRLQFASSKICQHLHSTGKTFLQLSNELLQLPGMSLILERLKLELSSMTHAQFYTAFGEWQVSATFRTPFNLGLVDICHMISGYFAVLFLSCDVVC